MNKIVRNIQQRSYFTTFVLERKQILHLLIENNRKDDLKVYLVPDALHRKIKFSIKDFFIFCAVTGSKLTLFIQPSVAFHIETSHLFCSAKQKTGFYMKCNIVLNWVKKVVSGKDNCSQWNHNHNKHNFINILRTQPLVTKQLLKQYVNFLQSYQWRGKNPRFT